MVQALKGFNLHPSDRALYASMTLREVEYLEYIRSRDLVQYGEILHELKRSRKTVSGYSNDTDLVHELDRFINSLSDV